MPTVTVIIPLYNKANYSHRAITSVLDQTFSDFELIIVDDGSTDGSREIAQSFDDPRVHVIEQVNSGPGAARNRGIAEAQGPYLAFLDADDAWLPVFLEHTVPLIKAHPHCAAVVPRRYTDPDDPQASVRNARANGLRDGVWRMPPNVSGIAMEWAIGDFGYQCVLYRTDVVRELGGHYVRRRVYGQGSYMIAKLVLNYPVYRSMQPLVFQDLSASELFHGRVERILPLAPMVSDPDPIREVCPGPYRNTVERWLAYRALLSAINRAQAGEVDLARQILRDFPLTRTYRRMYWALQAGMWLRPLAKGRLPLNALAWRLRLFKSHYSEAALADVRRSIEEGYRLCAEVSAEAIAIEAASSQRD